jgi:HlyD family secretion protein
MKQYVKTLIKTGSFILAALVLVAAWTLYFHNDAVTGHAPQWGWLQATVKVFGQSVPKAAEEDEDPDNSLNEIPVHVGQVTTETLHRYVDGYGQVVPQPPRKGQMSGSANIASSVAGVVAKVDCSMGQKVHAGDDLVELDNRLAKSAEDQAAAALAQEEAALAALKAQPRPEQVAVAQLAIDKAQSTVEFAQKNYDRQQKLVAEQGTAGKNVEQAATDLAAAKNDLAVAQKQMAILKATPTPEDLRQEEAKVRQAAATVASAKLQSQLLTIKAPIDGTVTAINVNPGESVDTTKTLVSLVALDRLMVDVDVPADQLPANAGGLPVVLTRETKDKPEAAKGGIEGKVSFVSPQVETKNGAVMLGIDLPAGTELRPGLTVRVRIIAEEHKGVLAVPREAVVANENGDNVISLVKDSTAVHRTVKVGLEENGLIEIQSDGVKEGALVVTQGAFGLRSTQQTHVKVVE